MKNIIATLAAASGLAGLATAQVSQQCQGSNSDLCYSLNIPESTSTSGTGDIFFQIQAPTTYSWVGLGQGDRMRGANMFVVYASPDGNVTLSPRLGKGNVMPLYNDAAQVQLLSGSGIANGMMTANVKCSSCNTWTGGEMNFQSTSASWIFAALTGDPLDSSDKSESISYHSTNGIFNWDFSKARGGSEVNPFVTTTGATTTPAAQQPTMQGSSSNSKSSVPKDIPKLIIIHAFLASIAWIIIFPAGAILIRVFSFRGAIWVHAALQMLGWFVFIAAFGLGLYCAITLDYTGMRHIIIGLTVFALFALQPLFGLMHHLRFKKTGARNFWSYIHVWIGRVAILLAMINGGLGLADAETWRPKWIIAYSVVAGVFGIAYIASIVFGETRRAKQIKSARSSVTDSDQDVKVRSETKHEI